jgi:hypothetical protein
VYEYTIAPYMYEIENIIRATDLHSFVAGGEELTAFREFKNAHLRVNDGQRIDPHSPATILVLDGVMK